MPSLSIFVFSACMNAYLKRPTHLWMELLILIMHEWC